jgi:hypothetical protein
VSDPSALATGLKVPTLPNRDCLTPEALATLERLAAERPGPLGRFDGYLAGSAGLALHLAHRRVRDLDFMSASNRLTGPERRDLLADLRTFDTSTAVETARDGYLYVRLASGVALRFFHYPYPLVEEESEIGGVAVASLPDLGLMKLAALVSRGAKRDFADLYAIDRAHPIERLLDRGADKFGHVGDFALQALKALTDWSETEGEPMPEIAVAGEPAPDWPALQRWLAATAVRLTERHLSTSVEGRS